MAFRNSRFANALFSWQFPAKGFDAHERKTGEAFSKAAL
jgi:hypothetical protein